MITLLLPDYVATWWGELGVRLAPAIRVDPKRKIADVYRELMTGHFALFTVNENGVNALAVVAIDQIDETKRLSLVYVAGTISPLRKVRDLMQIVIDTAKDLRCTEVRIEGRDWSRFFPDWERMGDRNGLRLRF
jgi:hypothetical protein